MRDVTYRHIMSALIVVGSFSTLAAFIYHVIPEKNRDLVSFAFGSIISQTLPNVVRYYFPTKQEDKTKKDQD